MTGLQASVIVRAKNKEREIERALHGASLANGTRRDHRGRLRLHRRHPGGGQAPGRPRDPDRAGGLYLWPRAQRRRRRCLARRSISPSPHTAFRTRRTGSSAPWRTTANRRWPARQAMDEAAQGRTHRSSRWRRRRLPGPGTAGGPPFQGLSSHAGSWRASLWERFPYNESMESAEDREWSWRVLKEGWVIALDPELGSRHAPQDCRGPSPLVPDQPP